MQMQGLKPSFPLHHRKTSVRAVAAATQPSSPEASGRRSLYEVLSVRRNASPVEIKTAYRTLAKLHHPDASMSAAAAAAAPSPEGRDFIQINKAYTTLSDPDARAVYDSKLIVDSQCHWDTAGVSGYRSPRRGQFYPTRKWETDQCW